MNVSKALLSFAVILLLALSCALAQGPGAGTMRNYDPKTETRITGTIDDVQQTTGRHGWMGVHLMLKTTSEVIEIHVGPAHYIEQQNFSFAKGDTIEVLGSRVKLGDQDAVIAREITKNGKTLTLRNAQGVPQWSGAAR